MRVLGGSQKRNRQKNKKRTGVCREWSGEKGHKPTEVVWGGLLREARLPSTLVLCLAEPN